VSGKLLIDTGPLVQSVISGSRHFESVIEIWGNSVPPALTVEAVVSEACFLLDREKVPIDDLFDFFRRGILKIGMHLDDHLEDVRALLRRYQNRPMSLADACLVRLSELNPEHKLLTFDSDFQVYRRHGNKVIPIIDPSRQF
jgi:predicted nucleic acid-binding protein